MRQSISNSNMNNKVNYHGLSNTCMTIIFWTHLVKFWYVNNVSYAVFMTSANLNQLQLMVIDPTGRVGSYQRTVYYCGPQGSHSSNLCCPLYVIGLSGSSSLSDCSKRFNVSNGVIALSDSPSLSDYSKPFNVSKPLMTSAAKLSFVDCGYLITGRAMGGLYGYNNIIWK